jgi:ABC-2 type transport system permease protein
MLGMFALQLIFLSLGTGIAAAAKRPKASASTASAILLAAFILSSVVKMNSSLGFLKYFTPFQYFDAESILDSGGFQAVFVLLSLAMIAVLVTLTYVSYQKRDMRI